MPTEDNDLLEYRGVRALSGEDGGAQGSHREAAWKMTFHMNVGL
jgi:hypothetical protein